MKKNIAPLFIFFITTFAVCKQKNDIGFDNLFHDSDYGKVIELCMQIWADLDGITSSIEQTEHLLNNMLELQLVRLARIEFYCTRMRADQQLCYEDFHELLQIIILIQDRMKQIHGPHEDLMQLYHLVKLVKQHLSLLMDNTQQS